MKRRRWFAAATGDEISLRNVAAIEATALQAALQSDSTGAGPDGAPVEANTLECELIRITQRAGVDVATATFDAWLRDHPVHGAFIRRVEQSCARPVLREAAPTLIVVPGLLYERLPELGADGRLIRDIAARCGIASELAPTNGLGSISENADQLVAWLGTRPPGPYWIVSISRGSSDVQTLLDRHADAPCLQGLSHWISVCGIVAGSPLYLHLHRYRATSLLFAAVVRVLGGHGALGAEMQMSHPLWQVTRMPPGVKTTHVVAVPSSWDVSSPVVRRYTALSRTSPTDGIVRLSDYCRRPARVYPIRGADHMLRTNALSDHLYRLINCLGDEQ